MTPHEALDKIESAPGARAYAAELEIIREALHREARMRKLAEATLGFLAAHDVTMKRYRGALEKINVGT